jgi:hypothetical protein
MREKGALPHLPRQRDAGEGGRKSCPPHGPLWVHAVEEGIYEASCLVCGAAGPKREDGWEAKLAFDESFRSPD